MTGAANGGNTNITWPDSIVNRVAKALAYLGKPWSSYLTDAQEVRWSDVIIAGHSNGADHTAFLAKNYNVSRALIFAGPNDWVGGETWPPTYTTPAPWVHSNWTSNVTGEVATPPDRIYGFGVCGSNTTPASGECWNWHPGWEAMGLRAPWFKADTIEVLYDKTQPQPQPPNLV